MIEQLRLIIDPPLRGSWNMAVDQAILETARQRGWATLRLYRWSPPTISLGYFQGIAERLEHVPSRSCAVVRRATGGGAIVHHHELTYSLCLPAGDRWSDRNRQVLDLVHRSLIDVLAAMKIRPCRLFQGAEKQTGNQPFLCFLRRADGDVTLGENKIIGSAQRRVNGALLQHGSLLIRRSQFAPELPGVGDLLGHFDEPTFIERWTRELGDRLEKRTLAAELESVERHLAKEIEGDKFASQKWTNKR